MKKNLRTMFIPVLSLISIEMVSAHNIGGSGFTAGIIHPFAGMDHLLAMVAVGIIGIRLGKKSAAYAPLSFIVFMIFGGLAAIAGIQLPLTELWVSLSVLALGIMMALSGKINNKIALACIALFAIFHGHAHGEEMPLMSNPAIYIFGFIISTAVLHISGIIIGIYSQKTELSKKLLAYSGIGTAMAGILFFI